METIVRQRNKTMGEMRTMIRSHPYALKAQGKRDDDEEEEEEEE